jgi:hypothetical protein
MKLLSARAIAVSGAIAATTMFYPAEADADTVLDAHYSTAQNVYGFSLGTYEPIAQTFTVVNTGTLSSAALEIEAVLGSNQAVGGTVTLEITKAIGGLPSLSAADILGAATLATNLFPIQGQGGYSFTTFSLPEIQVTAGEQLAIQLFTSATGYFGVQGDLGGCCGPAGTYAGGQGLYGLVATSNGNPYVTSWASPQGVPADFAFETFVTTAVPEPSGYALMLAGVAIVTLVRHRRNWQR